jgi:hypothetical protein
MRLSEVANVDVVADGGSVWCRVIGSEEIDYSRRIDCGGDDPRDEVWLGLMLFAQIAVGVRACSVEVTQRGPVQAVSAAERSERLFNE